MNFVPALPRSVPRRGAAWWLVPAMVLLVAMNQWRLAATERVSPWVGAGFGMFATVDGAGRRLLASADGTEVEIPPFLQEAAQRAAAAPHPLRLARLAETVRESAAPASEIVRVEVWRPVFDGRQLNWELVAWSES